MRGKELLDKMELADFELVKEAGENYKYKKLKPYIFKGLAACICLALVFAFNFNSNDENTENLPDLPMLTLPKNEDAMGFEGYMAHDINELVSGNPWNESIEIKTLPVIKNANLEKETDINKLKSELLEIAEKLGIDEKELTIKDNGTSKEDKQEIIDKYTSAGDKAPPESFFAPTAATGKTDGIEIRADKYSGIEIIFEKAVSLPCEFNISYSNCNLDAMEKAGIYLAEEFSSLLNMKEPCPYVEGGDLDIYERQNFKILVYDKYGSPKDQIISYNFKSTEFILNEKGELWIIRIPHTDLTNIVADYPVITAKEAKKLLSEGKYTTSVPFSFPGEKYIAYIELCYCNAPQDEVFFPYYRFLAELPEAQRENIKTFGAYYVPAVNEKYISNMPL